MLTETMETRLIQKRSITVKQKASLFYVMVLLLTAFYVFSNILCAQNTLIT